ncbi:DUF3297 family protein [Marinobacter aromaticivorans]|uniref:DUF3297 family protein n=1 Tax=Marinobacter aromaticivorans TaxID=1494078 RepID=A0ABW2IXA9_9GAMM
MKLNGKERTNVEEYCISEGWVKTALSRYDKIDENQGDNACPAFLKTTLNPLATRRWSNLTV